VLAALEASGADPRPALALVAARGLTLDDAEVRPAVRRAMLLLAAGGDPHRGLELDGRAVMALADELTRADRVAAVESGLAELRPAGSGLPAVSAALEELLAAPELAWRAYACALLADELAD